MILYFALGLLAGTLYHSIRTRRIRRALETIHLMGWEAMPGEVRLDLQRNRDWCSWKMVNMSEVARAAIFTAGGHEKL